MSDINTPSVFRRLISELCISQTDLLSTNDGFFMARKSISDILSEKNIFDFPFSENERADCSRFFDDWFLYAVPSGSDHTCSLLKMREPEYDAVDSSPADGDMPGVTISFISFDIEVLFACLADSSDENRKKLSDEINRVVAYRGQRHHNALKAYFKDPASEGSYLVADVYTRHIAMFSEEGCIAVSEHYKKLVKMAKAKNVSKKIRRLPDFIESLNKSAGYVVCDNEKIYIKDKQEPTKYERLAILATHTGNVSFYSFAAEVEYHARYLIAPARIRIPFMGGSVYDSAIRADMTVGDTEFEGPAPFYKMNSKIVRRQFAHHKGFDSIEI